MNRKIKFSVGEFYHIYNRGVEKREIFLDPADYRRFVLLLALVNNSSPTTVRDSQNPLGSTSGTTIIDIGAYCLMPNHFHILVKEKIEGGITSFLRKLSTAYTMYFNKKYDRVGGLFQGTFKAEHANTDEYLKYLFSYIHLNPVKLIQSNWKEKGIIDAEKVKDFLKDYQYSSYLDYHNPMKFKSSLLNKASFPEYFVSGEDFNQTIFDWLYYSDK